MCTIYYSTTCKVLTLKLLFFFPYGYIFYFSMIHIIQVTLDIPDAAFTKKYTFLKM